LYWALVAFLDRRGILEKYNITAWGPILMVRTMRGQSLLDLLGRAKSFWRAFASIGVPVMFIGMLSMLAIVVLADYVFITQLHSGTIPEPGKFNEPRNIFLIPGLSEFIPLTWGILALAVTLIVHEFSHAVLCKVEGVRVKSMGVLLAPIPIGGFAEPDEEQLLDKSETGGEGVASKGERMRILSAGVMSNFVTALIAFTIFFGALGAIAPSEKVMITSVEDGSPAEVAGLQSGMAITHVGGVRVESAGEFILEASGVDPGSDVALRVMGDGGARNISMPVGRSGDEEIGLVIDSVVSDSAAESAGLSDNMVLKQIDSERIGSFSDFASFMNDTRAGQPVRVEVFDSTCNRSQVFNITLGVHPDGSEKGFLGISPLMSGGFVFNGATVGEFPAKEYLHALQSIPSKLTGIEGWFIIFTFPIMGLGGEGFPCFGDVLINFYEPIGMAEPFGNGIFWIANAALWIGWINFYVGLFNCLPAVPLDGGHVFKDTLGSIFNLRLKDEARSEKLSRKIVTLFAVAIFSSFLLMITLPWIIHGL